MTAAIDVHVRSLTGNNYVPRDGRAYKCSVEWCSSNAYAKRLCNTHYIRQRNGTSLDTPIRIRKRLGLCSECEIVAGAKGGWGMCTKHYKRARRGLLKAVAVEVMGGACCVCKIVFEPAALDFHHVGAKTEHPSAMFVNQSVAKIAAELSHCELLCSNCHRIHHAKEYKS